MPIQYKRVFLRILLYLGLAFGGLGICALLAAVSIREHITDMGPWLFLAGYTGVLVWVVVSTSNQYWRRPGFWLAVALLAVLHVMGFISVLRRYPAWRPLWYIPVIAVEGMLFLAIIDLLFRERTRHRR